MERCLIWDRSTGKERERVEAETLEGIEIGSAEWHNAELRSLTPLTCILLAVGGVLLLVASRYITGSLIGPYAYDSAIIYVVWIAAAPRWDNLTPLIFGAMAIGCIMELIVNTMSKAGIGIVPGADIAFVAIAAGVGIQLYDVVQQRRSRYRCNFLRADLTGISLHGSLIERIRFDESNLRDADLAQTRVNYASFAGADLRCARLADATLSAAKMRGADLRFTDCTYTRFSSSDLRDVDFGGADLRGASFWFSNISGARFEGAAYDRKTRWPLFFDKKKLGVVLLSEPAPKLPKLSTIYGKQKMVL